MSNVQRNANPQCYVIIIHTAILSNNILYELRISELSKFTWASAKHEIYITLNWISKNNSFQWFSLVMYNLKNGHIYNLCSPYDFRKQQFWVPLWWAHFWLLQFGCCFIWENIAVSTRKQPQMIKPLNHNHIQWNSSLKGKHSMLN